MNNSPGANVFERLQGLAREIPEKKRGREIAKLQSERIDDKTGQLLYRPKTGRTLQGRSEEVQNEGGISNYLYKKHRLKEEAQQRQKQQWANSVKKEIAQEKAQNKN